MMPDKSQGGLLARLQDLSGCQYLSDLHSPFYIQDIIYAARTQIFHRGQRDAPALRPCDKRRRRGQRVFAARFDLDKCNDIAALGDQVDLAAAAAPVALQDAVALRLQRAGRKRLPGRAVCTRAHSPSLRRNSFRCAGHGPYFSSASRCAFVP